MFFQRYQKGREVSVSLLKRFKIQDFYFSLILSKKSPNVSTDQLFD